MSCSIFQLVLQLLLCATLILLPLPPPSPPLSLLKQELLRDRLERHRSLIEAVMASHSASRLTSATWEAAAPSSPPPPQPLFFLTAAASWGKSSAAEVAAREAQYAANIGGILALGFRVLLAVSPPSSRSSSSSSGAASPFPLADALAAAAAPGQLRVHHCSPATRVKERSGGPDELLCMQEAIVALFDGCIVPGPPFVALAGAAGCPHPDAHIVRMSGRYLMAKHTLLAAINARGEGVDAFVKWGEDWVEEEAQGAAARTVDPNWRPLREKQVLTFFLAMKFPHFVACHLNNISVAADWGEKSNSVWRFSIEKLTADCVKGLRVEGMTELGIVANVGNSAKFTYF